MFPMNELNSFFDLKIQVLNQYKIFYPYFNGDWKSFSSEDIRNLIEKIEEKTGKTLSEKWIYTHLKPADNQKLPRKDTLNILAEFVDCNSWDEFLFKSTIDIAEPKRKNVTRIIRLIVLLLLFVSTIFLTIKYFNSENKKDIELKNEYTGKPIQVDQVTVYKVENDKKIPIVVNDSKIELNEDDKKIVIESPFFETKEIVNPHEQKQILIKPDDYAMVLKTFIESDLKDWKTRKSQLDKILSDELEVILLFQNDLGAEYMNKEDFASKLIIPTSETKKWEILQLETNFEKKIKFIRIRKQ